MKNRILLCSLFLSLTSLFSVGQIQLGRYLPVNRINLPAITFLDNDSVRFAMPPIHYSNIMACPAYDTVLITPFTHNKRWIFVDFDVFKYDLDTVSCLENNSFVMFSMDSYDLRYWSFDGLLLLPDSSNYPNLLSYSLLKKDVDLINIRCTYKSSDTYSEEVITLDTSNCYKIDFYLDIMCFFDTLINRKIRILNRKKLKVGNVVYKLAH